MNKDIFEGSWDQLSGEVQKKWGKLTKNQLTEIAGNRKKLTGVIQENYGLARDEAEKQVEAWEKIQKKSKVG